MDILRSKSGQTNGNLEHTNGKGRINGNLLIIIIELLAFKGKKKSQKHENARIRLPSLHLKMLEVGVSNSKNDMEVKQKAMSEFRTCKQQVPPRNRTSYFLLASHPE